jgi:BlaI family transcriptional regulator, penicillinase repressor
MTDADLPRVSTAEWAVAEAVWSAGRPISSVEIVEFLAGDAARHPKTVRTLLHRLVQKKVLVTERRGRVDYYFPRLSRGEYLEAETRSLLDRLFAGRRADLLEHYLRDASDLSPAQLAALRERLDALSAGRPTSATGHRR